VPTSALLGVPVSAPVTVLKLAHAGLFAMEKPSVPPLGLVVVGTKHGGRIPIAPKPRNFDRMSESVPLLRPLTEHQISSRPPQGG
jgi:hypothetical protein